MRWLKRVFINFWFLSQEEGKRKECHFGKLKGNKRSKKNKGHNIDWTLTKKDGRRCFLITKVGP